MTPNEIGLQRLGNQQLANRTLASAFEIVSWMGAMQAQDYKQALWAIGCRLSAGARLPEVEAALANHQIIRTWPMRGTIHFIPAEDARWMLSLGAAKALAGHGRRMKQLDLTEETMARCTDLFTEALDDAGWLSRGALLQIAEDDGISTAGQRGYHILWHLAHQGVLVLGAGTGQSQQFALLRAVSPAPRQLSRDAALVELLRRYLRSHGPATEADFARWSGLTLTETRRALAELDGTLQRVTLDDATYYQSADPLPPAKRESVHLLAGFDEFLLGYKDRSAVLPEEHAQKVVPGNNGVFQPLIVVGGQVVGTWKRTLKAQSVDITLHPFAPLGKTEDAVRAAASDYAQFMGLRLATVTVDEA